MTNGNLGSGAMFDGIAKRYDLLNRLMSLGLDHRWRRRLVASLELRPGQRVLDLATGTGDVALEIVHRSMSATVVGIDPSAKMLEVAKRKVHDRHVDQRVTLEVGDAQQIAHPDETFDAVTISFGIRNVPDRPAALREMLRVLKPGGALGILELAEPEGTPLAAIARIHVRGIVPRMGALLSGQREYRYLQQSIAKFPPHGQFVRTIEEAGFVQVDAKPMTFGSCVLFTARRAVRPA